MFPNLISMFSVFLISVVMREAHTVNDRLSAAALIYIFPVKDRALIRERLLFQRRVKHLREYIEN